MSIKKINASWMAQTSEFVRRHYTIRLPRGWTLKDVLEPTTWAAAAQENKLQIDDIVRVRADDRHFDMEFVVVSVTQGAVTLQRWPIIPDELEAMMGERIMHVVPVGFDGRPRARVEEQESLNGTSRWRVIALNGEEISGHGSRKEAEGALEAYLDKVGYRMPTPEEAEQQKFDLARQEEERAEKISAKKSGKRLIA
jgi:acid stress-induced BolA-like protein IbaG/YrbA